MFTETGHTFLFCTVSRADVNTLRRTITAADPNAFVVIGHGHQAIGGVIGRAVPDEVLQDMRRKAGESLAESPAQEDD